VLDVTDGERPRREPGGHRLPSPSHSFRSRSARNDLGVDHRRRNVDLRWIGERLLHLARRRRSRDRVTILRREGRRNRVSVATC
jgi:hypothetical protein